jgi:ABC-2 type transport system permease protein
MFGIGLSLGGWAKNEEQAAPLANLVTFPMMFLSGVFFPTYIMPQWLQNVSHYIPLTPIVDSFRQIITEGKTVFDLGPQLLIIAVWTVVSYIVAGKVFRWE